MLIDLHSIYVLTLFLVLLSQCHALSSSNINISSANSRSHSHSHSSSSSLSSSSKSSSTSISTKATPPTSLDLSNSDLGPDLRPLPEDLVWDPKQNKTVAIKMDPSTKQLPNNNATRNGLHETTDTTPTNENKLALPSGTGPRPAQITGCRTHGQIAVTYSEGPSDVTAKIVRNLNNADARANFFFNASWLYTQQYAMVVQNIYSAGHFIGMSYRVKNDDSSLWTDAELRQDIIKNARTIETLIRVSPKYVRLHYTPKPDVRVESILHDLGFVLVGYNLDSQDYSHKEPTGPNSIEDVYRRTFLRQKDTYDAKGSFISIQYDIPDTGALAAVPFMINTINEEGYTMVRLDGCLNDPKPYKKSADSKEYVSDHFSFNATDYHQGQKAIAAEALVVEDWESEEDRMFKNKKSQGTVTQVGWFLSVNLVLTVLSFL